jgi:hypothetical protein
MVAVILIRLRAPECTFEFEDFGALVALPERHPRGLEPIGEPGSNLFLLPIINRTLKSNRLWLRKRIVTCITIGQWDGNGLFYLLHIVDLLHCVDLFHVIILKPTMMRSLMLKIIRHFEFINI